MNLKKNLHQYIDAGYPILYIDAYEEIKTDEIVLSLNTGRKIIEWNAADGLVNFQTKTRLLMDKTELNETLSYLNEGTELNNHLLVLKDAHRELESDSIETVALLKRICQKIIKFY